jgi:hypothetical protein
MIIIIIAHNADADMCIANIRVNKGPAAYTSIVHVYIKVNV